VRKVKKSTSDSQQVLVR